jgi:hypothetical protein
MRLIYHDSGKLPGEQGFKYITALKPDPNVIDYYSGFKSSVGVWDPVIALECHLKRWD